MQLLLVMSLLGVRQRKLIKPFSSQCTTACGDVFAGFEKPQLLSTACSDVFARFGTHSLSIRLLLVMCLLGLRQLGFRKRKFIKPRSSERTTACSDQRTFMK